MGSRSVCNIFIILISLASQTFSQVEFVTKPPEEVKTFPWHTVTLPCILKNLNESQHTVEWVQIQHSDLQQNTISKNRDVLTTNLKNFGHHFSILGDGMNFTLQFTIPKYSSIDFGTYLTVSTSFRCSVVKQTKVIRRATSYVIIQKSTIVPPICGLTNSSNVIGETIKIGCYNSSNPTIITRGKRQIFPINYNNLSLFHYLKLTKEDHNAIFVCESRKNGTNEIQSCPIGPINVNYKPEINIIQISALEFQCTAEARPPVNVTQWIVNSSIPKDNFIILNNVLKFTDQIKVDSKWKISCEAENSIGKGIKTLIIPVANNQDEENGNGNTSVVNYQDEDNKNVNISVVNNVDEDNRNGNTAVVNYQDEDNKNVNTLFVNNLDEDNGKGNTLVENSQDGNKRGIPVVNKQNEGTKTLSTSVVVTVVTVVLSVVFVHVIIILLSFKQKQRKKEARKIKNTVAFQKNEDSQGFVYDYATINVTEFQADYQETENEIYVDGDRLSNGEMSTDNRLIYKNLEDLEDYKENENEIYERPNI